MPPNSNERIVEMYGIIKYIKIDLKRKVKEEL